MNANAVIFHRVLRDTDPRWFEEFDADAVANADYKAVAMTINIDTFDDEDADACADDIELCEKAYRATQNIHQAWAETGEVTPLAGKTRSTCVGDMVVLFGYGNGLRVYQVASFGFTPVVTDHKDLTHPINAIYKARVA